MTETFSLTDVGYIKRVVVGNDNPETAPDEKKYERQMELLNRCLKESPKGKIVGQEKNFYLLNLGEHQVVMQYIVYHIGFARKEKHNAGKFIIGYFRWYFFGSSYTADSSEYRFFDIFA